MKNTHPIPAIGHMPFEGHRTVAEVWEQRERTSRYRRPSEFGFDPASLRPHRERAP